MGYLENMVIEIDAILTKKGREKLASGINNFNITQFALADDEIDYSLWNPNHTLGSNYYGEAIENLPILEANPDETQAMKYFLITLQSGVTATPYIVVSSYTHFLEYGQSTTITPTTLPSQYSGESYIATINNPTWFDLVAIAGASKGASVSGNSKTVSGTSFRVTSKNSSTTEAKYCILTIVGAETGGSVSINLTGNIYREAVPVIGTGR